MQPTPDQQSAWTDPDAIRAWWATRSQSNFHRPWSAEQVASLRGPFVEYWPASEQGRKLRALFDKHQKDKTASVSIGAPDVVTAHLMADTGYDTIYVSGGVCSMTDNSTQDFGADMADYPADTVPNKVKQLFRSQLFAAKNARVRLSKGEKSSHLSIDRMVPLIADADTGHGGQTANMKLAKLFVEAGAAAVHIDDQVPGTKKFGAKTAGRVMVPVEEHISRMLSIKLQFDVMGVECMIIHRTDAETAGYLTSAISPVDRPYVLGSTNPSLPSLVIAIASGGDKAKSADAEDRWVASAGLMSLDDAIRSQCPDRYDDFAQATKGLNVSDALQAARSMDVAVVWDAEAARSREGWYRFAGSIKPAIDRAIACAKYADMLWTRTPATVIEDLTAFAQQVLAAVPGALLGYNLAPDVKGTDQEIKAFTNKLANMGYVWQFLPMAGLMGSAVCMESVLSEIKRDGLLGMLNAVKRPGLDKGLSIDYNWMGGPVADEAVSAVTLW